MIAAPAPSSPASPVRYQRHRPEQTELHRIVRENLEALRAPAEDEGRRGPPSFVQKTFEAYLTCGLLCLGFLRAICDRCPSSVLIAFSCKKRGLCPSCGARRMEEGTEHIMTRVLPEAPVRQWVLSLPFQLRLWVAYDESLFSAIIRIFVSEVFRVHQEKAREAGLTEPVHSGAIACPQRFGNALNCNPHLHAVVLDGVYARDGGGELVFHALPPPTPSQIQQVSAGTCRRVLKLLRRRGLTDAEGLLPLEEVGGQRALGEAAERQWPLFAEVDGEGRVRAVREAVKAGRAGEVRGFSTHAGVCASGEEREKRRRIVRYCLRPPFAAKQVRATRDGRVALMLRHPRSNGATHAVFTELGFMRKLAAIVPPPVRHEVRYFGVLSSASRLRSEVVPAPRVELGLGPSTTATTPEPSSAGRSRSWAKLLERVYGLDALACPSCPEGRLKIVAAILEPAVVKKILLHLELDDEPPRPRPRRDLELFPDA
jgi:hypothetical protein